MKKLSKVLVAVLAVLCMGLTLTACGEKPQKAVEVTAVYMVDPGSAGTATYRTVPMGMIENNTEIITVYSDGTYCLELNTTIITNMTAITEGNDQVINRGNTTMAYYGKFTKEEDSGITTLTLSKPTRLVISNTNTIVTGGLPEGRFDSAKLSSSDTEALTEWWTAVGGGTEFTVENLLNKFTIADGTEVLITEKGTFEYINCSYLHFAFGVLGF